MIRVKICGLTTLEDALLAIEAGADLLGFNFHPASPRHIFPTDCARLVTALASFRPAVQLVGVFVNTPSEQIRRILASCNLDLAQLSGDEPAEDLARLGVQAFKAFRPASPDELEHLLQSYPLRKQPPACLLDAYRPGQYGGTGQVADWSLAAGLARRAPLLLAGGLRPENVAQAVTQVHPWGVDVASGVESSPGRKDPERLRAFIQAARTP
jgi:phosphoribosylanthranilate isomerase